MLSSPSKFKNLLRTGSAVAKYKSEVQITQVKICNFQIAYPGKYARYPNALAAKVNPKIFTNKVIFLDFVSSINLIFILGICEMNMPIAIIAGPRTTRPSVSLLNIQNDIVKHIMPTQIILNVDFRFVFL